MKALIMKDIITLKKTLLFAIPLCIVISGYGIYQNTVLMIPLLCAMMPLILGSITFGYDAKSKFEQFAFSMPIKKSSYVLSKIFFAFAFGIFGAVSIFILLIYKWQMPLDKVFAISLLTLVASVLIYAIQLPFVLKFGAEKGRLIMVITYFLIFALSTLLKENAHLFKEITDLLSNTSSYLIFTGIILAAVILIFVAITISIRIMENKEY